MGRLEPGMLLTSPSGSLDVVEGGVGSTQVCLLDHLDEFGVSEHHRLRDANEGLVRQEQGIASHHRVTLRHSSK